MEHTSEDEVWRVVPGREHFEASSLGRVRRKPFIATMHHGGRRSYAAGKATFGVPVRTAKGRLMVTDAKEHGGGKMTVSRMVCEAFHGFAPPEAPLARHLDDDHTNNRPSNLAWGTYRDVALKRHARLGSFGEPSANLTG